MYMLSLQVNRWDYRLSLGSTINVRQDKKVMHLNIFIFVIPHNHQWISSKEIFLCKWRRTKDNIRQYVDKRLETILKKDLFNTYKLL